MPPACRHSRAFPPPSHVLWVGPETDSPSPYHQVVNDASGLRSLYAALYAWPNVCAANLCFFPAGILQVWGSSGGQQRPARALRCVARGALAAHAAHAVLPGCPPPLPQLIESTNMDWESRLERWEAGGGKRGARPRHRLLPRPQDLQALSWWASVVQLTGMLG